MKRIITLLFASLLFTTSFAQRENRNDDWDNEDDKNNEEQYGNRRNKTDRNNNGNYGTYGNNQNSALVVNAFTSNRFKVVLDYNNEYQSNNSNGYGNTVNVGSLLTGNHTVTIYELKRNFFGGERQQQIYNAVLFFKPGIETMITIDNGGQIAITEKQLFNNNGGYNNGNGGTCGNGNGYGYGKRKHKRNGRNYDWDDDRRGGGYNNYPGGGGGYGYGQQMSDFDFNNMKQFVRKEAFDDRRMNIVRQAAGRSNFSTAQVRDLMGIFSFDEGKLDLAKYLYNNTIDRNNYYQLSDALTFASSKDALLEYIRRQR
jgi:hypothetical protein